MNGNGNIRFYLPQTNTLVARYLKRRYIFKMFDNVGGEGNFFLQLVEKVASIGF